MVWIFFTTRLAHLPGAPSCSGMTIRNPQENDSRALIRRFNPKQARSVQFLPSTASGAVPFFLALPPSTGLAVPKSCLILFLMSR